jgi:hypothetical protein
MQVNDNPRIQQGSSDIGKSSRTLAVWLGEEDFIFDTYASYACIGTRKRVIKDGAIENRWVFIHFAYSYMRKEAMAFIKFVNGKSQQLIWSNIKQTITKTA